MLVVGFPTGLFAANCYVVAPSAGQQCVVIDPGQDAVPGLTEILREHRLQPAAVLVTHGHIDHMWSVAAGMRCERRRGIRPRQRS